MKVYKFAQLYTKEGKTTFPETRDHAGVYTTKRRRQACLGL